MIRRWTPLRRTGPEDQNRCLCCALAREKGGNLAAGDDASEVQLFPLDEPPTEMAFEADKKIIEKLRDSSLF